MGLNKGYNEYLRSIGIHRPYQDSLTEREIIHHIIECDPINNYDNDLENHYKDYYINFLDSAGLKNINKKSKRRKSKSKRRKYKRNKSKSKRRKSKSKRRKSKSKRR